MYLVGDIYRIVPNLQAKGIIIIYCTATYKIFGAQNVIEFYFVSQFLRRKSLNY